MQSERAADFELIEDQIRRGKCTPIISNRLMMNFLFGKDQLGPAWAEYVRYPLNEERYDMASIAQYVATRDKAFRAKQLYHKFLMQRILGQAAAEGKISPDELAEKKTQVDRDPDLTFTSLVEDHLQYRPSQRSQVAQPVPPGNGAQLEPAGGPAIGGAEPGGEAAPLDDRACPSAPHDILAGFNVPIYVTTSYHSFVEKALDKSPNRTSHSRAYVWKPDIMDVLPASYTENPDIIPDRKQPLVYHLFGVDEAEDSMVMSVDEHLDFVINMTSDFRNATSDSHGSPVMPRAVRRALSDNYLLLLGYSIDGWDLRVLLKGLFGGSKGDRPGGVAIQFEPEEDRDRIKDPLLYQDYLVRTFRSVEFDVVIGQPMGFLKELWGRLHPAGDA
jgi:hypothetical protein